jgi:ABC-type uncharacterized transport system auxiliary subunit
MRVRRLALAGLILGVGVGACGRLPDTRYYQLAAPRAAPGHGDLALAIEPLATDPAYDDERIVYRATPFRFDYYQYHRWSAAPGALVGDYLEQALERCGRFRAVTREATPDVPALLGGRVVAIEEVDASRAAWLGRIVLELSVTDLRTNRVVWVKRFEETEPLTVQSPEGLAAALSAAMDRITARAAPEIEGAARAAQLSARR